MPIQKKLTHADKVLNVMKANPTVHDAPDIAELAGCKYAAAHHALNRLAAMRKISIQPTLKDTRLRKYYLIETLTKIKKIVVKSCREDPCPFRMNLPDRGRRYIYCDANRDCRSITVDDDTRLFPTWCPLEDNV